MEKPGEPAVWKPFGLRPGDYFKYAITDHPEAKQGWFSVRVAEKGADQIDAYWEGDMGGQKVSVTTTAHPNRLIERSRPQLITSPPAVPFLATILATWWDHVSGFRWEAGARWTVEFGEMVPAGFTLEVQGHCSVTGVNGFTGQWTDGTRILGEACVSPGVPLPLSVLTKDSQGNPFYEARLIEYTQARQ